jgi:hypothetical protein
MNILLPEALIWKILPGVKSHDPKYSNYKVATVIFSSFKKWSFQSLPGSKKAEPIPLSQ